MVADENLGQLLNVYKGAGVLTNVKEYNRSV